MQQHSQAQSDDTTSWRSVPYAAAALLSVAAFSHQLALAEAATPVSPPPSQQTAPGGAKRSDGSAWPVFRRAEVATHTSRDTGGVWVTYRDGVYDVTDFVANHPGGSEKLLLAAGKSVDAFWSLYPQHLNTGTAVAALAARRIGTLHADDVATEAAALPKDDPYRRDPVVHPAIHLHARTPATAEAPLTLLVHNYITPTELWFVRSHHPVPATALAPCRDSDYPVQVTIAHHTSSSNAPVTHTLTLADLKTRFPRHTVITSTQCGGNRRSDMNTHRPTAGIAWAQGAISTAQWTGVRLRDVLKAFVGDGDSADLKHVVFTGADGMTASIPASKALASDGDVLLAYEMNGAPIPAHHGAPLRAVVPGYVGVRSVKWLTSISTSAEEGSGPWQRGMAYKAFPPGQTAIGPDDDVASLPSVQEQPVNSAIAVATADGDVVSLKGYAYSGGGRRIIRVDVSVDGGATWHTASVEPQSCGEQPSGRAWAWTLWEANVSLRGTGTKPGDKVTCVCKATDEAMNTQPERVGPIWNLRGLNCNAWHTVQVTVAEDETQG